MELGSPLMRERPRRFLRIDGQDASQTAVPVQEHFIPAVALAKGADVGVGGPERFVWRVCHIRTLALIGLSVGLVLAKRRTGVSVLVRQVVAEPARASRWGSAPPGRGKAPTLNQTTIARPDYAFALKRSTGHAGQNHQQFVRSHGVV
jgi:hypothetical protein